MDQIRIKDLQVFANHGVFPEETVLGQKFLVSADLFADTRKAGRLDDLSCSIHYGEVAKQIDSFLREHTYQLLEAAAEALARELLLTRPLLFGITLEIKKPWAPVGLGMDTVSVKIHRSWHTAYVALGSNLGAKEQYLNLGVEHLKSHPDIRVNKISSYYVTQPYGVVDQDEFLNGCMEIQTLLTPEELLDVLQEGEQKAGRKRVRRWGPRTLDLDLLFYDKEILDTPRLLVPHPEIEKRDFVLEPMNEIAPWLRHPIHHKTMRELWEAWQKQAGENMTGRQNGV